MTKQEVDTGAIQRFWAKVDRSDRLWGCWTWTGSTKRGYGRFQVAGRQTGAHRFSYELHNGPIPDGLMVCHRCNNRGCVRPEHLYAGTAKDNWNDSRRRGTATWVPKPCLSADRKAVENAVKAGHFDHHVERLRRSLGPPEEWITAPSRGDE